MEQAQRGYMIHSRSPSWSMMDPDHISRLPPHHRRPRDTAFNHCAMLLPDELRLGWWGAANHQKGRNKEVS